MHSLSQSDGQRANRKYEDEERRAEPEKRSRRDSCGP